jgi:addiction module HigA family antidote
LREFVLEAHGLKQHQLAQAMGVTRYSINQLVNDRRSVTAEMALRLAKATSTSPQFWLNLQQNLDLVRAKRRLDRRGELDKVRVLRVAVPEKDLFHDVDD